MDIVHLCQFSFALPVGLVAQGRHAQTLLDGVEGGIHESWWLQTSLTMDDFAIWRLLFFLTLLHFNKMHVVVLDGVSVNFFKLIFYFQSMVFKGCSMSLNFL